MKAAFYTLGCKVNQYETGVLESRFQKDGFTIVPWQETADVYVVNSCTVTGEGDRKTRQIIRRLRRQNEKAVIALTGCFPQAFPEAAKKVLEADVITGTSNRAHLLDDVKKVLLQKERVVNIEAYHKTEPFEKMESDHFPEHTRAFLKIQDGCDRWCSYCIIPKARGPIRSKPLADIQKEAAALLQNGYREIVLTGINLSSYGKDGGYRLPDAMEAVAGVEGVQRLRLGSLEPELLSDDDLARMQKIPAFCPQFHLSLQSGCDDTLRRMNRHYTIKEYQELVDKIRRRFDNSAVTTDMMTGFPGESEEDFSDSLAFAQKIGFAKVHVFPYSVREGTRAALMEQIPQSVREERARRLIAATEETRDAFLRSQIGKTEEVLFETRPKGLEYCGYTKNYTPVSVPSKTDIRGGIFSVQIEECDCGVCRGTLKK